MKKERQHSGLFRALFATLVFIFLPVITPSPVNPHGPVTLAMNDVNVIEVTINNMAHKYHYIYVGERRFRVSPGASITDPVGRSIPLRLLPVPCRAKMTYQLFGDHRDPLILKIQVR